MRGWGVAWSCNVYLAQSRPWLQSLAPKPEKKKKSSPSLCQWLSGAKAPETQGSCLAAWPFFPGLGPSVQGKPLLRSHPTILVPVGSVPSSLQADATGWVGDAFGDGSASCCVLWSAAFQGPEAWCPMIPTCWGHASVVTAFVFFRWPSRTSRKELNSSWKKYCLVAVRLACTSSGPFSVHHNGDTHFQLSSWARDTAPLCT